MKLFWTGVTALIAVALFLVGCAVNRSATPEGAPLARQLTQSDHCGLTAPGLVYVDQADQIARLEHLPARNLPLDALKAVDFDREHLLLIGLGQKPTGGYGVTLEGAEIREGALEVAVNVRQPATDAMVTQALTTPCAVIAVSPADWEELKVSGTGMDTLTRKR
ncbi:protease complex subunit PrcB family protein [Marinobacter sp.]|uniref:protease complex subunit PrcB family protein n=1 Tax=Marinobacter sp. TaxID=50741 RepID=UPI0034A4F9FA